MNLRPNKTGLACNYSVGGQILAPGTLSRMGLPNFSPYSFFAPQHKDLSLGNDTLLCYGDSISFSLSTECSSTFLWQDGSADSTYTIKQAGTYWVQITNSCFSFSDTIRINFDSVPLFRLISDTTLCQGDSLLLDATIPNANYLWQNGSTSPTFQVSQSGTYWVEVTSNCGTASDTIDVNYAPAPSVTLGNDTSFCQNDSLILDAGVGFSSYLWQDGSQNQTCTATAPGTYWVEVTNVNGCKGIDSINIIVYPNPNVHLGTDTTICSGNQITLDAGASFSSYLWQDGSQNQTLTVTSSGTYRVEVMNSNGCKDVDSINIAYAPLPLDIGESTIAPTNDLILYLPLDSNTTNFGSGSYIMTLSGASFVNGKCGAGMNYLAAELARYQNKLSC